MAIYRLTLFNHEIWLQTMSYLEFDLSMSLKVKSEGDTVVPIYGFLLMYEDNIGPN